MRSGGEVGQVSRRQEDLLTSSRTCSVLPSSCVTIRLFLFPFPVFSSFQPSPMRLSRSSSRSPIIFIGISRSLPRVAIPTSFPSSCHCVLPTWPCKASGVRPTPQSPSPNRPLFILLTKAFLLLSRPIDSAATVEQVLQQQVRCWRGCRPARSGQGPSSIGQQRRSKQGARYEGKAAGQTRRSARYTFDRELHASDFEEASKS